MISISMGQISVRIKHYPTYIGAKIIQKCYKNVPLTSCHSDMPRWQLAI